MQILYEPLFRLYNVDIVFNGHDHNYERAGPMYNYKLDPECGTVRKRKGSVAFAGCVFACLSPSVHRSLPLHTFLRVSSPLVHLEQTR